VNTILLIKYNRSSFSSAETTDSIERTLFVIGGSLLHNVTQVETIPDSRIQLSLQKIINECISNGFICLRWLYWKFWNYFYRLGTKHQSLKVECKINLSLSLFCKISFRISTIKVGFILNWVPFSLTNVWALYSCLLKVLFIKQSY